MATTLASISGCRLSALVERLARTSVMRTRSTVRVSVLHTSQQSFILVSLEVRVVMSAGSDGCEPTHPSRKVSDGGSARGSATSSRADSEERLALLDPIAVRSLCLSFVQEFSRSLVKLGYVRVCVLRAGALAESTGTHCGCGARPKSSRCSGAEPQH